MALFVIIFLVVVTAASGAIFKPGEWYEGLQKPNWTPPNWAFPVVWTILYALIAWAGWIAWHDGGLLAQILWVLQLIFNAAWSWLFFGRKRMDQAFVDVLLLALTIALFMITIAPSSALAAGLFLPYLVWVLTAATLNWQVWQMNKGRAATGT